MTTTRPAHVRDILFDRLHNVRDLGGWRTSDGRAVAFGRLYRADSLGKLVPGSEDERVFLGLGVRTVVDLRYPWEIEPAGRVPAYQGLAYRNLSIEHRPYHQPELGAEVEPGPFLAERYREVAEDGAAEIRQVLELVADPASGPLAFHCASGKDRTGLIAALVLTLLGVPEADVAADFALTERAREALTAQWSETHGGRLPDWPGYGRTPTDVITRLYAGLREDYGSVEGYAQQRLGLDGQFAVVLRERLLVE